MFDFFGKNAFARKRRVRGKPTDCVSAIECLEDRIVLASQVFVDYDPTTGSLSLTGSGDADNVRVTVDAASQVTLTTLAGGTFTGDLVGVVPLTTGPYNVTGNITISMGNGGDLVVFRGSGGGGILSSGNIHVDMGSGADTMSVATAGGINLTVQGDVTVIGGTGDDTSTFGDLGSVFVCQNLTIDNGVDGGVGQSAYFDNTTINGNLSITNSGTGLQDTQFGFEAPCTVNGSVVITQANSANLGGYRVDALDTSVVGNFTITNGSGTGTALARLQSLNVVPTIGGSLTITNGNNASNTASLGFDANSVNITFAAGINATNGNATVSNAINIDGVVATGGSSWAKFTNGSAPQNDIIFGAIRANTFQGMVSAVNGVALTTNNAIVIDQTDIAKTVNLTNGVAADDNLVTIGSTVAVVDSVSIGGNLVIKNGVASNNGVPSNDAIATTDDAIVTISQLDAGANVTISTARASGDIAVRFGTVAGANTIDGNLSISNLASGGARSVAINRATITGRTGAAINNVGAGNSTIDIGIGALALAVTIDAKLDIQDGTATNTLTTERLTVGSITYNDLGGGVDTINLGDTGAGTTQVNGVTRLNTGNGSDLVNIGDVGAIFNGLVSVSLGSGNDSFTVGANAASPAFSSANNFQIDGDGGVDTITVNPLSISNYVAGTVPKKLKAKITNFESIL